MKPNSKVIVVTGGIASGKSTLIDFIRKLGYYVISADHIARQLMRKGQPTYEKVVKEFGRVILCPTGEIDRKKLGNLIFNNEVARKKLNSLTHEDIMRQIGMSVAIFRNVFGMVFIEIPLYFEEKQTMEHFFHADEVWLVYLDHDSQVKRLMERNHLSLDEATCRVNAQMPIEKKAELADFIFDNRQSMNILEEQLKERLNLASYK